MDSIPVPEQKEEEEEEKDPHVNLISQSDAFKRH